GRWGRADREGNGTVPKDADHHRNRLSLPHLLVLRVELLAELHDGEAALTERGTDRGRRIGRPRRHLQFDVSGDFLCHALTPVIGLKRPLQGPWCGFWRLAAAVTSHVHVPLRSTPPRSTLDASTLHAGPLAVTVSPPVPFRVPPASAGRRWRPRP